MNAGKRFEEDFKESFDGTENLISVDRLLDPMGGAKGVSNICDFIVYRHPCIFYLELKSIEGNTLNFKSDVSDKQIKGLKKKAVTHGAFPGLLVNYRDHEETYFVHIMHVIMLMNEGKKSLHIKDAREYGHRLLHTKKITRYTYHIAEFLGFMVETHGY